MGLAEQEQALFALVFDPAVRAAFHAEPHATLARLGVPAHEHGDFLSLSHFGLDVDARDRELLVLARLVRSFPLTVAATSAFPGGVDLVKNLVGPAHFAVPVEERPARFGAELHQRLTSLDGPSSMEQDLLLALARWEATLAHLAASARTAASRGEIGPEQGTLDEPTADWQERPLALAPFLAVARFPVSLVELTRTLVPCRPEDLWARLLHAPLPRVRLQSALEAKGEGRLVLGRAVVVHASPTDSEVIHRTMEVAAGFEAFLAKIDGTRSARKLLQAFVGAGAPPAVVDGVRAGLHRLVQERMLRLA